MAEEYFLFDSNRCYSENNVWFQTRVKRQGLKGTLVAKDAQFYDCLVLHPDLHPEQQSSQQQRRVGLILKDDVAFATHVITLADGARKHARLMVKVRESKKPIDPFDFSYGKFVLSLFYFQK